MKETVSKNSVLRKKWDIWMVRYKDSIREVAKRAGLNHVTLASAINTGVASEEVRTALRSVGIPEDLIPLPRCPRLLADMIYEQRANA